MKLSLVFAEAVFAALALAAPKECSIQRGRDGAAVVRGTVERNDHSCAVDGGCSLRLQCQGLTIVVAYVAAGDLGELPASETRADTQAAFWIKAGQQIEAHGQSVAGPEIQGKAALITIKVYAKGGSLKVTSAEGAEALSVGLPQGPASGTAGRSYTYTARGMSSLEHAVEYTIQWGDGRETVVWEHRPEFVHTWQKPGTYQVTVRARCAQDQIPELVSEPLIVTIR